MTGTVEGILKRYGQRVTLRREGEDRQVRAFLQPLRERGETVPTAVTPLGWADGRRWLYLGRTELKEEDVLLWRNWTFRVRSCRPHYVGGALSHWRGVLERAKEAAE